MARASGSLATATPTSPLLGGGRYPLLTKAARQFCLVKRVVSGYRIVVSHDDHRTRLWCAERAG